MKPLRSNGCTPDISHSRLELLATARSGGLNWIVKLKDTGVPVGFVQVTVESERLERVADIAWVISPRHQGQGIASEATQAMITWLRSKGVNRFVANIHPDHHAALGFARRQGLAPTTVIQGGEIR